MFQVVLRDGGFVSSWPNPNPTKLNLNQENKASTGTVLGPVKTLTFTTANRKTRGVRFLAALLEVSSIVRIIAKSNSFGEELS